MPSWTLALEGARREVSSLPSGSAKVYRTAWFGFFAVRELLSTMRLLPFAIRAATARATLTRGSLRTWNTSNACVETSVQYGSRDRNLVDVYHPAGANESAAGLPVVLFVHGGGECGPTLSRVFSFAIFDRTLTEHRVGLSFGFFFA
mmetsp:Transcript_12489/g.34791  ORF Transcript_12489/g.34791 Transcript_12489/m.34791 type:complete len:147 (-) Transcript_12489:116-556(-)